MNRDAVRSAWGIMAALAAIALQGCAGGDDCPDARALNDSERARYQELNDCGHRVDSRIPLPQHEPSVYEHTEVCRCCEKDGGKPVCTSYKGQQARGGYVPDCETVLMPEGDPLGVFDDEAAHHLVCGVVDGCDPHHEHPVFTECVQGQ